MTVISNTTVLSNFAAIGQLQLLQALYTALHISTDVYAEMQAGFYERGLPSTVPVTDIWLWWQGDVVLEDALGDAAPEDGGGKRDESEIPPEAGRRRTRSAVVCRRGG